MTDITDDNSKPEEGEDTGEGKKKRGRKGASDGDAKKPVTGKGFGRAQTEEERQKEEAASSPFRRVIALGDSWWRRHEWEPNEDERRMVQMLKFSGYSDEDIAGALEMSVETLLRHFEHELTHGRTLIIGDLATRAYVRARQGNDVLTMFLLKTRANGAFSEKVSQAAAITEGLKDVEGLTEDRKAQVVASLLDLLNPKKEATKTTKKGGDDEGE